MTDVTNEVKEVCEKIRFLRQFKKMSQEVMAEKLDLSTNAYANMERGDVDITLPRLYRISQILGVDLPQLLNLDEKGVLYLVGSNYVHMQQHTQFTGFTAPLLACPLENPSLKTELEKTQLLLEQKDKEIIYLKQIIELLQEKKTTEV